MKKLVLMIPLLVAAQGVKLPPVQKQVLANGATVLLSPGSDVPLVTVRVVVKGGSEADPADKPGLANMMGNLLRRGTATRTVDQIDQQLDFLGATLGSYADAQSSVVEMTFLAKDADAALAILSEVVAKPSFPEAEFKKALSQSLDGAKASKDNPGAAISLYSRPFFYGKSHPYGRVADELTLPKLTRDDVVAMHQRMFVGKNIIVAATGRFDAAQMQPKLAAIFGALPAGTAYTWAKPAAPKFTSPRLVLVDKPDATQTYFLIGMPGIDANHPDRVALQLINTLFGGRFTSMLNDALRVNSGLTYGANSRVERNRLPGVIFISTYTQTDTTEKAIDMALDILKQLREKGISAEMLASAKAYVKGNFPSETLETAGQIADVIGDIELFGQNKGEIDDLFSRIDALTVEQANAIAKKWYVDSNLQFLLVGNASKIKAAVAKYAPEMKVVDIKTPGVGVE